jgi:hypothetical protein
MEMENDPEVPPITVEIFEIIQHFYLMNIIIHQL